MLGCGVEEWSVLGLCEIIGLGWYGRLDCDEMGLDMADGSDGWAWYVGSDGLGLD